MSETLDRARVPLLSLITQESLDRDYQAAASRRAAEGEESEQTGGRLAVAVVVGLFALLVTVAAVQTSQNADVADAGRATLLQRIESSRDRVDALQATIVRLRGENTEAEATLRALGSRYGETNADASALSVLSGFSAVSGGGVKVVVDNPDYAGADDVVRDSDLALLVNGLWAAGAEAVAINGQRLTATTAIRNSGRAIEVNRIGIAPPYTVLAVGNRNTLAADFVETESGQQFVGLTQRYGFDFDMTNDRELRLPAAPPSMSQLRSVERAEDPQQQEADQ